MAVQGEEPFEEDLDWLKYGRVMIQESPKILDEAAKTFLTLASTFSQSTPEPWPSSSSMRELTTFSPGWRSALPSSSGFYA